MGNTWRKNKDYHDERSNKERNKFKKHTDRVVEQVSQTPVLVIPTQDEYIVGKVKYYNNEKGFGFLTRDDGKADIFFHQTRMVNIQNPAIGLRVKFLIEDSAKGPRATKIELV